MIQKPSALAARQYSTERASSQSTILFNLTLTLPFATARRMSGFRGREVGEKGSGFGAQPGHSPPLLIRRGGRDPKFVQLKSLGCDAASPNSYGSRIFVAATPIMYSHAAQKVIREGELGLVPAGTRHANSKMAFPPAAKRRPLQAQTGSRDLLFATVRRRPVSVWVG